ncbi:phosphoribosyltransferase [Massilia cavernae]|uniref:Phosphoribosyltransferase n=1 Tax=Massilia cavernae TaxID=2320864 RepID=A0A418Y822_9BURK|nr:phosphoribosyltransferase family protein [Massilia cavernae]RJG27444.1 phosphoribosyltransferase [Massilia cavernae]
MRDEPEFKNRTHAGRLLAKALARYAGDPGTVVLALPRGGVPVGYAIAHELDLELDILIVRKLGMPGHEEYAIGAIGAGGVRVLQEDVVREYGLPSETIDEISARELREIERRERQYRGGHPPLALHGRTALLVDDGLATGSTMRAAIRIARKLGAARVVVAVPVGAPDTCEALEREVDELICLSRPMMFFAVSQWYRVFDQTSDSEVQDLLALAWREHPSAAAVGIHGKPAQGVRHEGPD